MKSPLRRQFRWWAREREYLQGKSACGCGRWHKIAHGRALYEEESRYVMAVLRRWLEPQ